jgi:hypothetical protein
MGFYFIEINIRDFGAIGWCKILPKPNKSSPFRCDDKTLSS